MFSKPFKFGFILLLLIGVLAGGVAHAQEATQEAPTCKPGFRLFDHQYLATDPVCIPENPQRILALDMASLEFLLYTDRTIVGTSEWIRDEMTAMLPELADELKDIPVVGYPASLETVLELKPDLILAYANSTGSEVKIETIDYEQGSAIAPIVATIFSVDDWEKTTEFWSEVLNEQPIFDRMQKTYHARVDELKAALSFDPAKTTFSLVTANTYGFSIWLEDSPQGRIVNDVGFIRPESQAVAGEEAIKRYTTRMYADISDERIDLGDGDVIFMFDYATTDAELQAKEDAAMLAYLEKPLWLQLKGVKAGRAYIVGTHWFRAGTYLLANKCLDDLFAKLTDTTSITPNPISEFE